MMALMAVLNTVWKKWRINTYNDGATWTVFQGASGTDTNYAEISDDITSYGDLALLGPAIILQILSMLGIAVEVNYMWWTVVVSYGVMLIRSVAFVVQFLGYERDWADGSRYAPGESKRLVSIIMGVVSLYFTMFENEDNWEAGIWENLDYETRKTKREEMWAAVEELQATMMSEEEEGEDDE